MTIDELAAALERFVQQYPKRFDSMELLPDRPATPSEIEAVERALGVTLPARLHEFWLTLGGGQFGMNAINSATPDSSYYLPVQAEEWHQHSPQDLIPLIEEGCGGTYVLKVVDGVAGDKVYFYDIHEGIEGDLVPGEIHDLYDLICSYCLS